MSSPGQVSRGLDLNLTRSGAGQIAELDTEWISTCHFLDHHGDDLTQLGFRDSVGRSVRIRDLYFHVGQCSQESCRHKIARDSQSLLDRSFTCHYKNHHPSLKTAYTPLVENGEVNVTSIISADHIKCKPCKVNLYNI